MSQPTKYINFVNKTGLPFIIDYWADGTGWLQSTRIGPEDKLILHSSVGEWHVHSMLTSKEDFKIWKDCGMNATEFIGGIGKFRSDPCMSNNYSWMQTFLFDCEYSENLETENGIKGTITFTKK